ncbi:galactokinase [Myxococcota bacterium]|nr:galactokinase [Myxococcota bacterium]
MEWWQRARQGFREAFGADPAFVADAGGRVNLIGEHTDYHEGFVFPAAIDLRTLAAGSPRTDGRIRIRSGNVEELRESLVETLAPPGGFPPWWAYAEGPLWALREEGLPIPGADLWVRGEVPLGGGLSSSASIQVALAALGAALAGRSLPAMEVARLARRSENLYCGVPCGAMDQVASACGVAGHALLLDCRTLSFDAVPFPGDWALVVADSGVRHSVAGSEYARRQQECARGMAVARQAFPDVRTARDLAPDRLEAIRNDLDPTAFRRLRHVVTENDRCLRAGDALRRHDGPALGSLLAGSHESLARDYEVSCPELDLLVEIGSGLPGCIGSRLTGAGFGGNTVHVVQGDAAGAFREELGRRYRDRTGRETAMRIVHPDQGVRCLPVSPDD